VKLSDDQIKARDILLQGLADGAPVQSLVGGAGTGKTTMVKDLADEALRRGLCTSYVFLAPTGKAASRLRAKGCSGAGTIHGALYSDAYETDDEKQTGRPKLNFRDPHAPCEPGALWIIDEGSMVDPAELYPTLLEHVPPGAKGIVVADKQQLPPITPRNYRGPDWIPPLVSPTAQLTTIHRQAADNPIIQIAYAWYQGQKVDFPKDDKRARLWNEKHLTTIPSTGLWLAQRLKQQRDATLVTYYNDTRRSLNTEVRRLMGFSKQPEPIVVGDRICVKKNNHMLGLMNGEVFTVHRVEHLGELPSKWDQEQVLARFDPKDWRRPPELTDHRFYKVWLSEDWSDFIIVIPGLMEQPQGAFIRYVKEYQLNRFLRGDGRYLTHFTWGYCLTVHSSQGSEWEEVGVYVDPKMAQHIQSRRWGRNLIYTAVTRAKSRLHVFWRA
jgi:exodeoxyribonuclease-5